jgi:ribosome recycling factor
MNIDITAFAQRAADVHAWLEKEFSTIRTGQATPTLLDSVKVESYGAQMTLQQLATVGVEDARTLRISPWDSSQVVTVEKAILDADLGLSVVYTDGSLRVIFPELTGERRQQLVKLAKQKHEDARVSLRSVRDEQMKAIDAAEKNGDISEDEKFSAREAVQKVVDEKNNQLDGMYKRKEERISKV